jgi:hypothetical protein
MGAFAGVHVHETVTATSRMTKVRRIALACAGLWD